MTQSFQQVNTLLWEPVAAMINDQVQHACKNVNAPSAFNKDVGPQAPSSIRRSRSYGSRNPDSSPPPTCPTPLTCRQAFFATATPTSVAPIPTGTGLTTMSGYIETTRNLVLYGSLPSFQSIDDDDDDDEQHRSQWSNSSYLPHLHDQMFHHWTEVCAKWEAFVRWTKTQVKRVPFDKFKGVDMDDSTFNTLMLMLMNIVIVLGCVWNKAGDALVLEEEGRDEVISLEFLDFPESSLQDGPSTQVDVDTTSLPPNVLQWWTKDVDTTADVEQEHKHEAEIEALLLQLSNSDSDTACFHDTNPIPADIFNAIDGSPTPSAFEPELASLFLSPSPSLFALPIPSESMHESSSSSSVHQDEDESTDNDIVPAPVSMSPSESTQIEFETTSVCEPEPEPKCDFVLPIVAVGGPLADLFAVEDAACSAPASSEADVLVEGGTDVSFDSLFDEKDGDDSREHQPDVAAWNCLYEYDSEEEEEEDQQREVSAWNSLCEYDSEEEAEQPEVPACEYDSEDKQEQPEVSAWNALCQYDSEEEEEEYTMSVSMSMSVDCVRCDESPLFAAIPQDAAGWNSLCEYDQEEEEEIMSKSVSVSVDDGLLFAAVPSSFAGMPQDSEVQVLASLPNFDYLPPICAVADLSRDLFDLWEGKAAAASLSPATLPEALVSDMISDSADTDRDTSFDSLFDEKEGEEHLPTVAVESSVAVSQVTSPDVVDVAEPTDVDAVVNAAEVAEPVEIIYSGVVDAPEDVQEAGDDSSIEIGEEAGEPDMVEAKIPEVELSFSGECSMDISVDGLAEAVDAAIVNAPEVEADDFLVEIGEEASEPATVPGDELSFAGEASMDISYDESAEAVDSVIANTPEVEDEDDSSIQSARVEAKIPVVELSLAGEASMDMDISLDDQEVLQQSTSTLAEPESPRAAPSMEAKGLQASMWASGASDSQEKTQSWALEVEEVETRLRESSSVNIETDTPAMNSDTTSHVLTDQRQVSIANCDRIANLIAMTVADHKRTRRPVTSTQRDASVDARGTSRAPRSAPTDENVPPSSSEEPKVSPHKKKSRGHRGGVAVRDRKAQVEARRLSRAVGNLLTVKN